MFLMVPVALVMAAPAAHSQPIKVPSPVNVLKKTGNCGWLCQVLSSPKAPDKILDPTTTGVPACYVDESTKRVLVCYDWNHPKARPRNYVARPGYIWKRAGKWWIQIPDPRFKWIPNPTGLHIPIPINPIEVPLGLF